VAAVLAAAAAVGGAATLAAAAVLASVVVLAVVALFDDTLVMLCIRMFSRSWSLELQHLCALLPVAASARRCMCPERLLLALPLALASHELAPTRTSGSAALWPAIAGRRGSRPVRARATIVIMCVW